MQHRNTERFKDKAARSKPSQARGKERVRTILIAALDLFKERGLLEEVTTNEIAERAGIPIGSLYRYYPNKDAILVAITALYVDDVAAIFDEVSQHPMLVYLSWEEILLLMVGGWVNYSREHGPFSFLYTERASPRLQKQNSKSWERFMEAFVGVLRKRCPQISERQTLVCFNLCLAATELGVNEQYRRIGGSDMYQEAVGVAASYMLRICDSYEHHTSTILP
jgi:AcrR family transcriptional regulator